MEKSTLVQEIASQSAYKDIKITKKQTVADLLKELKLEDAYLAVLVDGQKAELSDEIDPGQKIIILPKIAGGNL